MFINGEPFLLDWLSQIEKFLWYLGSFLQLHHFRGYPIKYRIFVISTLVTTFPVD